METSAMFEKAVRSKLRFGTQKGLLTVEDLWDLPLTSNTGRANLDEIAIELHGQLKNENVSFVDRARKSDDGVQLAFDIVKHIIDVKLAENEAAAKARDIKEKKQQIMALIAQKEIESLGSKSIDDLKSMLESM